MGYQYLTLAHILLVYDPNIPRVGPAHKTAIKRVDASLADHCRNTETDSHPRQKSSKLYGDSVVLASRTLRLRLRFWWRVWP